MSRLWETYFGDAEAAEDEEAAQYELLRSKVAVWIRQNYYSEDFRPYLKELAERNEPKRGQEKTDLDYHMGVRDGIRLVMDHLDELERLVRGQNV